MNINLAEFLKDYGAEIPESLRSGEIYKLTYTEKLDNINFFAHFPEIVPAADIFSFEKAMETAIKVDKIRLYCRYQPELFGENCYGELIQLLKRDVSVLNGFLEGADVRFGSSSIDITLSHGGFEMLEEAGFRRKFAQMIYNMFGVRVKVNLDGKQYTPQAINALLLSFLITATSSYLKSQVRKSLKTRGVQQFRRHLLM